MNREKIKNYVFPLTLIIAMVSLDFLTKSMIVERFDRQIGDRIDYFRGLLRIALVYNDGFVFGFGQGNKTIALVISIVVLALMVGYYIYEKNKTFLFRLSISLIASGALGNIIDRLLPARPGVVDFISIGVDGLYRWPSFNVADSSIVVGAFLLIIVFYQEEKRRKQEAQG
jgi:signal peptidase II